MGFSGKLRRKCGPGGFFYSLREAKGLRGGKGAARSGRERLWIGLTADKLTGDGLLESLDPNRRAKVLDAARPGHWILGGRNDLL